MKLSPLPNMASTLPIVSFFVFKNGQLSFQREQLQRHREKTAELQELLNGLRELAPSLKTKGKQVYDYFYRERFLEREVRLLDR